MQVSALFVECNGAYYGVDGVDPWCIDRDATKYTELNPVICHPPCHRWGKMARVNYARWGGEHNRPGNDGGTFKFALEQVIRCGGVLEHPAQTYAWPEYGLTKPSGIGWTKTDNGWVCEVWQSAYGHKANKSTWLFYVGNNAPFDLNWERPKGTHQVGFQDQRGKSRNKPTLSKRDANATPEQFKQTLINLARYSKRITVKE